MRGKNAAMSALLGQSRSRKRLCGHALRADSARDKCGHRARSAAVLGGAGDLGALWTEPAVVQLLVLEAIHDLVDEFLRYIDVRIAVA